MKDHVNLTTVRQPLLKEVDEHFRSVFMHMAEGVAIHEVIFDPSGTPVNYRILDVNPQYGRYTGLDPEQVVGRLADEIYKTSSPPFLTEYAAVAMGGEPARLEVHFEPLSRDYEISVAPMGYGHFATIFSDVTDRKRQERALRENEWFLEQSQRAGRLGSYRFNVTLGTWVNSPALDEVLGIDATHPRNIDGWLKIVDPDDRQSIGDYLANEVIAQGKTFDRKYRIVRQNDNEVRWVHGFGALEKAPDGKPLFMIGTIQDITESTLAEQALQAKTDELDHFFNLTPDMLCIVSPEARLLRVNAAWERILGWPLEELRGRHYLDLVHPQDRDATNEVNAALAKGVPVIDFTNRYLCKDGSYRWIEWRSSPTENSTIYAAARDVTDWIEHERAMRESEERYRLLVEMSPFLVAIHEQGVIAFINRAGIEMVGAKSSDEIVGRAVVEFFPDMREPLAQVRGSTLERGGEPSATLEQRLLRVDKKVLAVELAGVEFPYRSATATLLVALDVTERKRGELERRQLAAQLQQSQKLESIGRLAGGVAHDFNNLLTVIMSCADSLLTCDVQTSDWRSDVLDVADAGRRAAELTRQLLAFSRQQVLQPRCIVLCEVVERASRMLRRLLGEDIELVVRSSQGEEFVFADPGQVEQILVNLAVNARDAMPDGGELTIEVSTVAHTEVFAAGQPEIAPGVYILLTVTDTGIGMDEATRDRAFDPFFTTKPTKGTGLGLATVYGIVKQSGGHIWIQSEPGVGTKFTICLPRAGELAVALASRPPPALDHGDETILLVEDEEQVRRRLERVLAGAGYRVISASDGEEALRLCESSKDAIHLLLTDVVMPKMNGRQLAERLALVKPIPRVLYMSGYTADAIVHHGILDEGIQFIQKPLTPAALLAKLREVLTA